MNGDELAVGTMGAKAQSVPDERCPNKSRRAAPARRSGERALDDYYRTAPPIQRSRND